MWVSDIIKQSVVIFCNADGWLFIVEYKNLMCCTVFIFLMIYDKWPTKSFHIILPDFRQLTMQKCIIKSVHLQLSG